MRRRTHRLRGGNGEIFNILDRVSEDPKLPKYIKEGAEQLKFKITMLKDMAKPKVYNELLDAFTREFTSGDKPIPNKLEKLDNKVDFAFSNIENYNSYMDMKTDYNIYSLFKDRDKDFSRLVMCGDISVDKIIRNNKITDTFVKDVINEGIIYALNNAYGQITPQQFYALCKLLFYKKLFEDIKCVRQNGDFSVPQLGINREDCESDTEDALSVREEGLDRFKYIINGNDPASVTLRRIYDEMPNEFCAKDPITWMQEMRKK